MSEPQVIARYGDPEATNIDVEVTIPQIASAIESMKDCTFTQIMQEVKDLKYFIYKYYTRTITSN